MRIGSSLKISRDKKKETHLHILTSYIGKFEVFLFSLEIHRRVIITYKYNGYPIVQK